MLRTMTRRVKRWHLIVGTLGAILCIYFLHSNNRAVKKLRSDTVYNAENWLTNPTTACSGHFTGYGHQFVILRSAKVIDNETFSIPCATTLPNYDFLYDEEGPLGTWLSRLKVRQIGDDSPPGSTVVKQPTFAIKRIEAHNLYHTLCEWFNVFMVSKLLGLNPNKANILFLDDRPDGLLDETWDMLFPKVTRYQKLEHNVVFQTLIWNVIGYNSPANFHELPKLPYAEEFHDFFLNAFKANAVRALDCNNIHVTIIWRRDYMTHPERQVLFNGLVHRKFQNEKEIRHEIATVFNKATIREVVLEKLTMQEQVNIAIDTDVLVGMHGAGMAHALFLQHHAVVLEFFPNYWGFLKHFKKFSQWRNVRYIGWQNNDPDNEYAEFRTRIPPDIVNEKAREAKQKLSC